MSSASRPASSAHRATERRKSMSITTPPRSNSRASMAAMLEVRAETDGHAPLADREVGARCAGVPAEHIGDVLHLRTQGRGNVAHPKAISAAQIERRTRRHPHRVEQVAVAFRLVLDL